MSSGLTIVNVWAFVALVFALQAWLAGTMRNEPVALVHTLSVWLAWASAWALATPAALALVQRFPLAPARLGRHITVHAVAGAALALAQLALFAAAAPYVGSRNAEPTWLATYQKLIGTTFLLNWPVYWAIVGASQALATSRSARERERTALKLEAQLAEAKLANLRAQLEPHFLFNALNTVAVLMRNDVDSAERVLVQLSTLLRRTLDASDMQKVTLHEEIEILEAYLAIEQARFADRLTYRIDAAPDTLDASVPSLILQPLVENAVKHGLAGRAAAGHIEVVARRDAERLCLSVRDDGRGLTPGVVDGVGLSNTRSRLALLYGDRHILQLDPAEGGGVVVTLDLPLHS